MLRRKYLVMKSTKPINTTATGASTSARLSRIRRNETYQLNKGGYFTSTSIPTSSEHLQNKIRDCKRDVSCSS